jgi:exosome complex component RRP40
MNGRVWIHAAEPKHTVLLANAILNSEYLSADECKQMVDGLMANV